MCDRNVLQKNTQQAEPKQAEQNETNRILNLFFCLGRIEINEKPEKNVVYLYSSS